MYRQWGGLYLKFPIFLAYYCSFVYVRYKSIEEAEKALITMHGTYFIDVPAVSKAWNPKGNKFKLLIVSF